jgi:hypothetical protein
MVSIPGKVFHYSRALASLFHCSLVHLSEIEHKMNSKYEIHPLYQLEDGQLQFESLFRKNETTASVESIRSCDGQSSSCENST